MPNDYWQRQQPDKPLFHELLWSRPENRQYAGKLLIIGGNEQGFAVPAEAYAQAERAGIGTSRVLLPDALQKNVGRVFEAGEYAPSTPSGSFSRLALADFLAVADWATGTLVAGELGRNSETAILLESFIEKYRGTLVVTRDAVDYFTEAPGSLLNRPNTCVVLSLAQLQKLVKQSSFTTAITFGMDLVRLVAALHEFTIQYPLHIVVKQLDVIIVASNGRVSTTKLAEDLPTWRVATAAQATVWWLQNPSKVFEALTTAIVEPAITPH